MAKPWERFLPSRDVEAEAEELRRLRAVLGLTQARMAVALDVSPLVYHRWENARKKCHLGALEIMRVWAAEASKGKRKARR